MQSIFAGNPWFLMKIERSLSSVTQMGDSAGFMEEEYLLGDDWVVDAFDDLYDRCTEYVSNVDVIEKARQLIEEGYIGKIEMFMRINSRNNIDTLWRSALNNDDTVTAGYIIRFAKFTPNFSEHCILSLSPKMLNLLYGLNVLTMQKIAPLTYRHDQSLNNIILWASQNATVERALESYRKKSYKCSTMDLRDQIKTCKLNMST